jgi:hypothetical protein
MKLLLIAIAALFAAAPAQAQQQDAKELVGTWKVVAVKATSGDKVNYPLGEKPEGYITITSNRMWLLFVDGTRKAPAAAALTDSESIEAMKTHASWTGKYTASEQTPDGIKVAATVDTATSQALAGKERVYFTKVNGGKMTMKSAPLIIPMTGATSVVEIELLKAVP